MAATMEELTQEALRLPENERARFAQILLQSLDGAEDGIEEAWEVEVARRLEEVDQGTAMGRPAEEVFRDLRV